MKTPPAPFFDQIVGTDINMREPLIRPACSRDAEAIARIYNLGIDARRSTFETRHRSSTEILSWIDQAERYPVLVAEAGDRVLGWANLSSYRPRDCYARNAEFSIYLDPEARGRGLGRRLLAALIDLARQRGFSKLISRVFPFNTASLALCRALGFREVGTYRNHAQLDGRWLDVVIVERWLLDDASNGIPNTPAVTTTEPTGDLT